VVGVRLKDDKNTIILSSRGVISSSGYYNTMNNLVPSRLAEKYSVTRSFPSLNQSAGFVMANIGIDAPASLFGATAANTWHIPLDESGDIFGPISEYFEDPMKSTGKNISAFITFPSLKDRSEAQQSSRQTSCQMLFIAPFEWFEKYLPKGEKGEEEGSFHVYEGTDRLPGYESFKEEWKTRSLEILLKHFPKAESHIQFVDISTPLTIQHWLRATHGAAVGINSNPIRFVDPIVREELDPITRIPGLSLTGQDTVICGVTLCQVNELR
jgi:all-trans-retinol 13,14-reductase